MCSSPGPWDNARNGLVLHFQTVLDDFPAFFFFSLSLFFWRDLLLLSDILMSERHSKELHPNLPWNEPGGLLQERKVGQQDVKTKHARRMNGTPQKSEQVWHIAAVLWRGSTPPQHTSTTTHVDQCLTCFSAPRLHKHLIDGQFWHVFERI